MGGKLLPYLLFGLIATAPAWGAADRVSLLPRLFGACQNQLLANAQFISLLTLNRITVEEVCQCQGPLFISGLTDAQVGDVYAKGTSDKSLNERFFEASRLCAMNMVVRHNQVR